MSIIKNPLLFKGSQGEEHYYSAFNIDVYLNNIYPNVVAILEKLIILVFEQNTVFVNSIVAKM